MRDVEAGRSALASMRVAYFLMAIAAICGGVHAQSCLDLTGRWPYGPPNAVVGDGARVYFNSGASLIVADASDPDAPRALGEVLLPERVRDVAASGLYAYVADGDAGLQVVNASDPASPFVEGCLVGTGEATGIAVSGSNVYLAADGFRVIDVSNPGAPAELGTVPDVYGRKVVVSDDRAYVVFPDLVVIDVSVPSDPRLLGGPGLSGHEYVVNATASGALAYLVTRDSIYGSISSYVLDLSIPSSEVYVGEFWTSRSEFPDLVLSAGRLYSPDFGGLMAFELSDPAWPIAKGFVSVPSCPAVERTAASGNAVYLACSEGGVQIVDDSDCCSPPTRMSAFSGTGGFSLLRLATSGSYIYASDYGGLRVFDAANPTNPQQVSYLPTTASMMGVVLSGSIAYAAVSENGLQVFDIQDPSNPSLMASADTPGRAMRVALSSSGSWAYVADLSSGLQVVDISDPANPRVVGAVATPAWARDVAAAGQYVCVAAELAGLVVVDVSNPAQPEIVGSVHTPTSSAAVAAAGDFAFVGDGKGLRIVDISVPSNPRIVASIDTVYAVDDVLLVSSPTPYAFLAGRFGGMKVIDISDPTAPREVSSVRVNGRTYYVATAGTYAYLGGTGLYVVDISDLLAPAWVGVIGPSWSGVAVDVAEPYAYVADQAMGLLVIDASNAAAPTQIGSAFIPDKAQDVSVAGTRALVSAGTAGLWVVDITTPDAPVALGRTDTPGSANAAVESGNFAFVADGDKGLQVVGLTGPPFGIAGSLDTPGDALSVAVSGTGTYAYLADGSEGLEVMDVSNPAAPARVGSITFPGAATDVVLAASGLYAYVSCGDQGLFVVDVSAPDNPRLAASLERPVHRLALSGSLLYTHPDGLVVIDVSNPLYPREIGFDEDTANDADVAASASHVYTIGLPERTLQMTYLGGLEIYDTAGCCGGLTPRGRLESAGAASDLAISGSTGCLVGPALGLRVMDLSVSGDPRQIGYVPLDVDQVALSGTLAFALGPDRMDVIDLSDPTNPRQIGAVTVPGVSGDIAADGPYAYVAGRGPGFQIVDATNPSSPAVISTLPEPAEGLAVAAPYVFLSGDQGLRVVDISDPFLPAEIGRLDIPGSWGRKIVARGSRVYFLGPYGEGVLIIDVTVPASPREVGWMGLGTEPTGFAVYDSCALATGPWFPVPWQEPNLWVYDVSDPGNVTEIVALKTPADPTAVVISGSVAYVAGAGIGLSAYDLSRCCAKPILRYESKASLAAHTPEAAFRAPDGLPWVDPENVLGPSAPPALYYTVTFPSTTILATKQGTTVSLQKR